MQSVETANKIKELLTTLNEDLTQWTENGKKIAAKRARKSTLDLEKHFKIFRKQSVIDTK